MKKILITLVFVFISFSAFAFEDQRAFSQKYAKPGSNPLMIYDPAEGDPQGYVLHADLDGNSLNGVEAIVAYRVRISDEELEAKAGINPQYVEVDIVQGGKNIGSLLKIELAYTYTPKIFITTADLFKDELPKVFLMAYDGLDKTTDKLYTIIYNGMDPKDKGRKGKQFETVKMPWNLLINPLKSDPPMIMEYNTKLSQGFGYFYPRTTNPDSDDPVLNNEQAAEIKKMATEYKGQLDWEDGNGEGESQVADPKSQVKGEETEDEGESKSESKIADPKSQVSE